jgi:hypothetical protein
MDTLSAKSLLRHLVHVSDTFEAVLRDFGATFTPRWTERPRPVCGYIIPDGGRLSCAPRVKWATWSRFYESVSCYKLRPILKMYKTFNSTLKVLNTGLNFSVVKS